MKTVIVNQSIPVSAHAVWKILRTGDHLERWIPIVTACHLEGSGVGAKRVCVINGQELVESIETVDENSRLFQYRIHAQSLMPVRNALGTIHLTAVSPAETSVLWMMNFDMTDEAAWPAVKEPMAEIYRGGIAGLAALAGKHTEASS
jgi:uncharacterized protein YndB with AHSA1/START domain